MKRLLFSTCLALSVGVFSQAAAQDFFESMARRAAETLANRAVEAAVAPRAPASPARPAAVPARVPSPATAPAQAPGASMTTRSMTTPASTEDKPGIGESTALPVGEPFSLPEGLALETPIMGWAPEDPEKCDEKYADESYGHGERVALCLIFRNTSGRPIIVDLPPGLVFISRSDKAQNGLLVQRIRIEVPAGERYFAPVMMYCLNSPRHPSGTTDEYDLGPINTHPAFAELFSLLEGRDISREESGWIQTFVNQLQRTRALTAQHRARISGM
ncbi:MAG: hypothetical protein EON90_09230 [Brevundimonas sp.]|nr:MAG: hypothetical protein EON90_09230 [Brevundimonas sp.]